MGRLEQGLVCFMCLHCPIAQLAWPTSSVRVPRQVLTQIHLITRYLVHAISVFRIEVNQKGITSQLLCDMSCSYQVTNVVKLDKKASANTIDATGYQDVLKGQKPNSIL